MSKPPRDIRMLPRPKAYKDREWTYDYLPIIKLGEVGRWAVVRRADFPNAAPFVESLRTWECLDRQAVPNTLPESPAKEQGWEGKK